MTVLRNEIPYSLNKPGDLVLTLVAIEGPDHRLHYVRLRDFGVTSVNYDCAGLLAQAEKPS